MTRSPVFLAALILLFVASATASEPNVVERWAVLVGVDDYTHAPDLRFCGADQVALRERLIASGFRAENIVLLHDRADENRFRPSQRNITEQLRLVIGSAEADDLLVVGFSGHGVSLDKRSYFCPNDAELSDATTLISLDDVYEQLRNCSARFKWVLVDACRNEPTLPGQKSLSATSGTLQLARNLQELKLPEGVVLLNSCAPGEFSWEEEKFGHGVYMHYVLEAMTGRGDENGDGAVSLNELQRYASGRTKSYVLQTFTSAQRPFARSDAESDAMDFALLRFSAATASSGLPPSTSPSIPPPAIPPIDAKPAPNQPAAEDLFTNSIGMKLKLISAGNFFMGASAEEDLETPDLSDNFPQRLVNITKPFYLAATEVTQAQWETVMATTPWRGQYFVVESTEKFAFPATYVSWNDAQEFCRKLSQTEGKTYRLPTEAEWEYACRADTLEIYPGDDRSRLGDFAWYAENTSPARGFRDVAAKQPNAWGLFDMHGNVAEWCADWYDDRYYAARPQSSDPAGPEMGTMRVFRGGSWVDAPQQCRAATRNKADPSERDGYLGFRVVLNA